MRHWSAFIGYENDRDVLREHCPACHEGWLCPSAAMCHAEKAAGLSVRIPDELNLRRIPPIPRAMQRFKRLFRGRAAVELVNAGLKICWRAVDGTSTGAQRFPALVRSVLVMPLACATLLAKVQVGRGRWARRA